MRPRRKKWLLAAVMGWSLLAAPAVMPFGARGDWWGLIAVVPGIVSLIPAGSIPSAWHCGSGGAGFREYLTAIPVFTAAALLVAAPFLVPWAVHEAVGQSARARVVEVDQPHDHSKGSGSGTVSYRLADAETEEDLGGLMYGLPERTPVGAVIDVSVVPGGWSKPISAHRLADGGGATRLTVLRAMVAAHVLACAAVWVLWPRKDAR